MNYNNMNNSNNNNNNLSSSLNLTLSLQERATIIENIKKFLLEHLPLDQCNSPQKAQELAVRFENHVAMTSTTKEQYQGMIAEKLRMIKSKSTELHGVQPTTPMASTTNITTNTTTANSSIPMNPHEISLVISRLNQIRPQLPQIDKLLLLHSKLPGPSPPTTIELVKKLTECRNILVNQIEAVSSSEANRISKAPPFLMNIGQLNGLIEQVQRHFNSLVSKMKESAGIGGVTKTNEVSTKPTNSNNNAVISNNNNLSNSASSISSSLTASASASASSVPKYKTKTTSNSSTNNLSSDKYEKLLIQRLSLPDDYKLNNPNANHQLNDSFEAKLLRFRSSRLQVSPINLKHLRQRDTLLSKEMENLKRANNNYRIRLQDDGLGIINLQVISGKILFTFKISRKYPYDQLVYKISAINSSNSSSSSSNSSSSSTSGTSNTNGTSNNTLNGTLSKHREPKTFPISITNIIRNHESQGNNR